METSIEKLAHVLRARYGKEIAELKDELVVRNISSFVIKHSDLLDREIADAVVTQHSFSDEQIKQALIVCGVPESRVTLLTVRYVNVYSHTPIKDLLTSRYIWQMRSFEGIVRRVSSIEAKLVVAAFKCGECGDWVYINQTNDRLIKPTKCIHCGRKPLWELDKDKSNYIDLQRVLVQESPEGLSGRQPTEVEVEMTGDICNQVLPGDHIQIVGELKVRKKDPHTVYLDYYVEVNSYEFKEELYENMVIKEEDLEIIESLSKDSEILNKLTESLVPSVYGHVEIKRGLVLQLFGGVAKREGDSKIRGDIHILLVGDPGIAKSQMMMRVVDLSQRGVLVHGSGASKAGLTASAVNDGKKWVLDAGALVMADKGLCAVDEFEKMIKEDRGSIHAAMEQQVVAINKAGINTVLNCRCSLLAAANPKLGRFDLYKTVSSQLDFDSALLSRFDLIYPMMDIPDKVRDGAIIDHMCKVTDGLLEAPPISTELFRKYIAHARKINPRMSNEADELIKEYWSRQRDQYKDDVISINYRHMYSLHRLSEASARIRLSSVVTVGDAAMAISLVNEYLRKIAYDVKIGKIDTDRMSRVPKSVRNGIDKITIAIHNCSDGFGVAHIVNVEKYAQDHYGISEKETQETLEVMKSESMLFMPRPTLVKMMDRR